MSDSLLLEPLDHGFLSVSNAETVKKSGIYKNTVGNIRICFVLNIAAFDHLDYGKVEFFWRNPSRAVSCAGTAMIAPVP